MVRRRAVIVAGITAVAALISWASLSLVQSREPSGDQPRGTTMATSLGVTYLPVTPGVSAYYHLQVDAGALVTEVATNSPAERAGLKVGDVIIGYSGERLENGESLLGLMMACPPGDNISLEIWRGGGVNMLELAHGEK
ncbi:MAG: PDZ domain-containing protein [Chloroflexi bacterium]|nr:PDZ domain-containing protein [Chloroflexota bacterium]